MTSFIVLLLSLFLTTNIFSQFKQIYEKRIYKALMINSKCFLVCKPNDQIKRYIFFENMRSFCWRSLWVVIENKTLIANPKDERNHKYLTKPPDQLKSPIKCQEQDISGSPVQNYLYFMFISGHRLFIPLPTFQILSHISLLFYI